jgi:hypothetical protein
MLRTNAPWDTMPDLSWLGCEPARCVNWAARPDSSGRTVGVQHGVRKRCRSCAIFRPPTVSVVTGTLTVDRREAQRQTRPRRRSKLHVAAHPRTDACRLDGRPCAELAGRGSGQWHRAPAGPEGAPWAVEGAPTSKPREERIHCHE